MSPFRRLLLSLLIIALASGAIWCAFWQLRRLDQRRAANAAVLAGRELSPVNLADALAVGTTLDGRRAVAIGHFLPAGEVLLRGRVQSETPGLQVATPFAIEGRAEIIWVLRGFVASPDAATPPKPVPSPVHGGVALTGLLLPIPETLDQGQPLAVGGDTTWRRMDRTALEARAHGSLPVYLHLGDDGATAGGLPVVPLPSVDEGPHFSYAIQWFGIATAILVFGWLMVWRKRPQKSLEYPTNL